MRFQTLALIAYLVVITKVAIKEASKIQLEVYEDGDPALKKYCEMSKKVWKTDDEALNLLKTESEKEPFFKDVFLDALKSKSKCPKNLIEAECMAVIMYSSILFKDFNDKLRNGNLEYYKTLNALLHSAMVKLSKEFSSIGATVYRGVIHEFENPKGVFHFKQYSSTSFNESVAIAFNSIEKLMKFYIAPNSLVANISSMSLYPNEAELLISPFQAFQFVNEDKAYINFRTVGAKIKCP